jgi:ketosteroid isomerase-like protein
MTNTTANEALVRSMIDAFLRGDLDAVGAAFAEDAVWDFPGHSILNGVYKGPGEIVGFLARSFELSGGTLALDLIDVTASEHGACQAQWVSADHGGQSFRSVELLHHEIADGKIVRTWHRSDDVAITGFFGAP